jgi:long-chain-fatty-acid--CoA ligase ACSBG
LPNPGFTVHRFRFVAQNGSSEWNVWTWSEYRNGCNAFAKSLLLLGFAKFDSTNIVGFNSPEWFMANFGTVLVGGIPAGIYSTNLPEACKYVTQHSEAKVVVCEGILQLEKYCGIVADLSSQLKALVVYGIESVTRRCPSIPIYTFTEFLELGKGIPDGILLDCASRMHPSEVCTLIYTSGTTRNPKVSFPSVFEPIPESIAHIRRFHVN